MSPLLLTAEVEKEKQSSKKKKAETINEFHFQYTKKAKLIQQRMKREQEVNTENNTPESTIQILCVFQMCTVSL